MAEKGIDIVEKLRASYLNELGLRHYQRWELERAVRLFLEAIRLDETQSEYYLNLARAQVRLGNYAAMRQALRLYIRTAKDETLTSRFEALLSNVMDKVEILLTTTMPRRGVRLAIVGAAIQMWLEYRVTLGHHALDVSQPETWAAALDYTIREINLEAAPISQVAGWYGATELAVCCRHTDLVRTLDLLSCDYRYFTGEDNPLDQLVEAAALLEDTAKRFQVARQRLGKALYLQNSDASWHLQSLLLPVQEVVNISDRVSS